MRRLEKTGLTADPTGPAKGWFGLDEVDCPPGISRCLGGVVQTSEAARRPPHCAGKPEACACPWEVVAQCPAACVADGVEAVLRPESAASQLCEPTEGALAHARPSPGAHVPPLGEACEGESFVCLGSIVVGCEPTPRLIGSCARGCATDGVRGATGVSDAQSMALLCVR